MDERRSHMIVFHHGHFPNGILHKETHTDASDRVALGRRRDRCLCHLVFSVIPVLFMFLLS